MLQYNLDDDACYDAAAANDDDDDGDTADSDVVTYFAMYSDTVDFALINPTSPSL